MRPPRISAAGRRLAHGTYTIEPRPTEGSRVSFTSARARAPLADRLPAPTVRATMRRANRAIAGYFPAIRCQVMDDLLAEPRG